MTRPVQIGGKGPVLRQAAFLANDQGIATSVPNPEYWRVVGHVRTATNGRNRYGYTVQRDATNQVVLDGFSDQPAIWKRKGDALATANLLNGIKEKQS